MDVAGFPNRFCILLDFHVWVGLATTGHIRSLMIFSVHVISFVFLLSKYTNSIKVSNQIKNIGRLIIVASYFISQTWQILRILNLT